MRGKLRPLLMGLCLHILLSGFLLAGFRVYQRGYDHTHTKPIEPASLSVSGDSATVSVLSHSFTVPLPAADDRSRLLCMAVAGEDIRFWMLLLRRFII